MRSPTHSVPLKIEQYNAFTLLTWATSQGRMLHRSLQCRFARQSITLSGEYISHAQHELQARHRRRVHAWSEIRAREWISSTLLAEGFTRSGPALGC